MLDGWLRVILPDERLLIPLPGVRMPDPVLRLEILRAEGRDVLILREEPMGLLGDLTDRDEVTVRVPAGRDELVLAGCRLLEAGARLAGLEACWLLALPPLDLLLLSDLSAANAGPP